MVVGSKVFIANSRIHQNYGNRRLFEECLYVEIRKIGKLKNLKQFLVR